MRSSSRGAPRGVVVAIVTTEDGIGQVEEDDGGLREVGVALVLEAAGGHQVAGHLRLDELGREDRALLGHLVHQRLAGKGPVVDVGAAVPGRALPDALGGRVGLRLGGVEPLRPGK